MSFDECIINGQREGSITEDQARYARDLFEQNRADMIEELGQKARPPQPRAKHSIN